MIIIDEKDVEKKYKKVKVVRRKDVGMRKCCKCRDTKTYVYKQGYEAWHGCQCSKDDCTGWICHKCFMKYQHTIFDDHHNIIKNIADSRTGNLDRFSETGKGIIGQWIGGKTLDLKDMNIEKNNFNVRVDLSEHSKHGKIDVKTKTLDIEGYWQTNIGKRYFDTVLIICMDMYELWKNIERVYIIPIYVIKTKTITIMIETLEKGWYEEFRTDEKPFNDVYHSVDIPRFFNPWDLWRGKYNIR